MYSLMELKLKKYLLVLLYVGANHTVKGSCPQFSSDMNKFKQIN